MSNQSVRANIESLINNGLRALSIEESIAIGAADEETLDFPFVEFLGATPQISAIGSPDGNFDFSVTTVNDADESFDALIPLIAAVTAAAIQNFAEVIVGATGAVLDVAVAIADLGEGTVANATSGSFFFGAADLNGFQEILTGSQIELVTGIDPNGEAPDIVINVSTDFIQDAIDAGTLDLSFATDPDRAAPPAGVLDFVSVLTHEVLHGLGFLSFRGPDGADFIFAGGPIESTYGSQIDFEVENGFLTPRFNGAEVTEVYGTGTVLETTVGPGSDISHFAAFNPDGSLTDTVFDLENPFVIAGDIVEIGALDLALLRDIGYETIEDDRGLLNTLDFLPDGATPTVSVSPELSLVDGQLAVTVSLSNQLFVTVPSSVGLEITAADGTTQTQRVIFTPGDLEANVVLSEELLSAIGNDNGDVSLRLFFPAQAELASGANEEITLVDVSDVVGSDDSGEVISNGNGGTTSGADEVIAGNGDDRIVANGGNDLVLGNGGDDTISGGNGADTVSGGSGDDRVDGGNGSDEVLGGAGDDLLIGRGGDDLLEAGDGDDRLFGGNGADTLDGGDGSDIINGGRGNDTFNFAFGEEGDADILQTFNSNQDTIVLEGFGFADLAAVLAASTESRGGVEITLDTDSAQTLFIVNTDIDDLNDGNVLLAVSDADGSSPFTNSIVEGDPSLFALASRFESASSSSSSAFFNSKESDIDFDIFRTTSAAASRDVSYSFADDAREEFFAAATADDFLF